MTHGSLFSGIGGFDLAAEWMGWDNQFHCEINPFCNKILKHYWPNAKSYENIKTTDFSIWRGKIDILTGGFPCQPYSTAGKRKGKDDDRHLWPEMLRAIREIKPRWIVGENVRGLINWNGGLVFDEVQSDLEIEGYEVLPFLLPACAVNAPHKRERIWFIAYSRLLGQTKSKIETMGVEQFYESRIIANAHSKLLQGGCDKNGSKKTIGYISSSLCRNAWENFPTQSPVCSGDDGIPCELDGITFPKWRSESIKAYGNAIVPQVVYQIFKTIELCTA